MRRLPSLDSLRVFEAAARHLSLTKASDELHVTQSALSHRIQALEAELGVALFRRYARRIELTPAGEILAAGALPAVVVALAQVVVAVGIGIAMGRSEFARRFFEPAVLLGLTIPGLVWALLCVIWFGIDLINPVAAVALSSAPALMLTIYQGTRSVDPDLLEMAHVYRFSRVTRLRRLWLPALAPSLFAGARLGLSLGWKVIVLVEVFGMSSGVGYQLNNAFAAQNVAAVLAWTLLFAIVMAVLEYGVLQALERRAGRWRKAVTV